MEKLIIIIIVSRNSQANQLCERDIIWTMYNDLTLKKLCRGQISVEKSKNEGSLTVLAFALFAWQQDLLNLLRVLLAEFSRPECYFSGIICIK